MRTVVLARSFHLGFIYSIKKKKRFGAKRLTSQFFFVPTSGKVMITFKRRINGGGNNHDILAYAAGVIEREKVNFFLAPLPSPITPDTWRLLKYGKT